MVFSAVTIFLLGKSNKDENPNAINQIGPGWGLSRPISVKGPTDDKFPLLTNKIIY